MMGTTHVLFSLLIYFLLWRLNLIAIEGLSLIFIVIGSILPDIDHPNGLIYQFLSLPEWLVKGITSLDRHRGKTHTLWAAIVVLTSSILLFNVYSKLDLIVSLMFFLGYLSHLASDSLNKTGVKWLSPVFEITLRWKISTGSKSEKYFFYTVGILLITVMASKK